MSSEQNPYLTVSRQIPVFDYFSLLQSEYICYMFRFKTYNRKEDKVKFRDIMNMKRKKIESMSLKNSLPNIFNGDKAYYQKYLNKFITSDFGIPNYLTRDEYKGKVYGHFDKIHWLSPNTQVKFKSQDEILFGYVVKVYDDTVVVRDVNGTKFHVMISDCGRILTDKFLELE